MPGQLLMARPSVEFLESRRLFDGEGGLSLDYASGGASGADTVTVSAFAEGDIAGTGINYAKIKLDFVTAAVEPDGSIQAQSASASATLKSAIDPNFVVNLNFTLTYAYDATSGASAEVFADAFATKAASFSQVSASASGLIGGDSGYIDVTSNISVKPSVEIALDVQATTDGYAQVMAFAIFRW